MVKRKKKKKYVSGRKEHLKLNGQITLGLWTGCPLLAASTLFIFISHQRYDLIQWWWITALLLTPIMYRIHELWASPDMDDPKRGGIVGFYWKRYSKHVRHRGIFSHTLLIGSPVRFAIGYAIPLAATVLTLNHQLFIDSHSTLYILSNLQLPYSVKLFILWWFGACVLSDFTHLMLDRMFNPLKFLLLGDS